MIKKILFISGVMMFSGVSAQKTHTVAKGDNPYNIAKKYNMSLDELLKLNPKVKDGKLAIGDVVAINGKAKAAQKPIAETKKTVVSTSAGSLGYINLKPKQTVYGITKQYHISEAELRKLNPNLDGNLKIGDRITLPLDSIKKYGDADATVNAQPVKVAVSTKSEDADTYTVQPKDNYYRITKNFGLSQSELFSMNPGLEEKGLQPGTVIRVKGNAKPATVKEEKAVATPVSTNATTSIADDFVTYTVQDGDTVFGILNKFGVGLDELMSLNPQLSSGLKAGMVLKIKKADAQYTKKTGDGLNVVMMLPFGFDTNDAKFRTLSADFLTGAKLAIERNVRSGQKLNIKVIDAGNEASFKNSLTQINKENTDLIIGPFLKSNVKEMLTYLGNNKVPVVAPFANSEDLYNYDNLIIVETADNVYSERIVKEVAQVYSDQKIYIVEDADKANSSAIKSGLEKTLKNPTIISVNSAQDIQADKNMMTGQSAPVIAILASTDNDKGAAFSSRMAALGKEVSGMKAFSMFYHPSFEKNVDELSQSSLVYLMDRKINTEGTFEKEILAAYKAKYCKTPSKYAVIGFDVVNDILSRENKKGEVFRQIGRAQTQLATKFEYVKAKPNGAYINTGYRVVRLVP